MDDDNEDEAPPLKIGYLASYPPNKCGIGTFTRDLSNAINKVQSEDSEFSIIAIDNEPEGLNYPEEVEFRIRKEKKRDYIRAAEYVNLSNIDIVSVQHEYGLFGGSYGQYLELFLKNVNKPIITTMHTVLEKPPEGMISKTQKLLDLSDVVIVLSEKAKKFLVNRYDINDDKVKVILHGVPDVGFIDPNYYKEKFNVEGKKVILTFGLLSENKGIETAIKALPKVVKQFPDITYIILGVTHPEVKKIYGEEYRLSLMRLARKLGVLDNVVFINRYTKLKELKEFIGSADIYVTPYKFKEQVSSGTLAYAIGAGKAVVSTPYFYAEEMLADGRGFLFDFEDSEKLSEIYIKLLEDETLRTRTRKAAYDLGRKMTWKVVGEEHVDLFNEVKSDFMSKNIVKNSSKVSPDTIPELSLVYLKKMTDEAGLIQHAKYAIPDRHHGYSSDDAGRAIPLVLKHYDETGSKEALNLAKKYIEFLHYVQRPEDGTFHNYMKYDRSFPETRGGEDTQGRVIWGLGFAAASVGSRSVRHLANHMFDLVFANLELNHPQAKAYAITGFYYYLQRFSGAENVKRTMEEYADDLVSLYKNNSDSKWKWISEKLTYGLGKIPHSLLLAYEIIGKKEYLDIGIEITDFLTKVCIEDEMLDMVGSDGWYPKDGEKAKFIQQPIEAWYFIDLYCKAYELTEEVSYKKNMYVCFDWFFGNNIAGAVMGNTETGSCFDGIKSDEINPNRGAESTLAFLYAVQIMSEFESNEK